MTNATLLKPFNTTALDSLPVAVIIFDNEKLYYINKASYSILGIKPTKKFFSENRSVFDFLLPEYHERIRKNNEKILKGKKFESIEFSIKTFKGTICDIESKSNLIEYNGKKAIQTIILEVTNRKLKEKELVKSDQLFSLISEHANDVFFKLDFYPKPNYAFISQSLYDLLGYSKKAFLEQPDFYKKIVLPEDRNKLIFSVTDFKKFILSKQESTIIRYRKKNNAIVWLETIYSPIKNESGEIISIIGISRDVTRQKNIELELKETQEKFNLITTNAKEIIYFYTYHPMPRYLYMSPSVKNVLGYSPDDFYRDPFFISKKSIGKNNDLKKNEALTAIEQKQNKLKAKSVTYQVLNSKNEMVWMEDSIIPIRQKNKEAFYFGVVRNITDLKEKELELNQKWIDYKELLNESPVGFFIHDKGICKLCNKEAVKILKAKSIKSIIGKNLFDYIVPNQIKQAKKRINEIIEGREGVYIPYTIKTQKGTFISVELKSALIKYEGEDAIITIIQDITNKNLIEKGRLRAEIAEEHNKKLLQEIALRKKIEEKLVKNEKQLLDQAEKLNAIFESSAHLVWTINKNLELTYSNKNYDDNFIRKFGSKPKYNIPIASLLPKHKQEEYKTLWLPHYLRVLKGEAIVFERKDINDKGDDLYREVFLNPIKNDKGEVYEIACLSHDITENKKYEKQIVEQASKINAIFESGSHMMWTINKDFVYTSFNNNFIEAVTEFYGVKPELNKLTLTKKEAKSKMDLIWETNYKKAFQGKAVDFILDYFDLKGQKKYKHVYLHPITNTNNEVVELSGRAIDITDNKLYEERITQSLKEKEILLKEVHHRVKNNMQVISSILNLQSSYVTDQYALGLLKESQNRIKTMAYIHESLYQNKTFSSINFSDYVSTLVNNILQSYTASIQNVNLKLNVQKVILNLDTSIPAGLIINELVTNAIKHGFSDEKQGIIYLNLYTKDNVLFLEVIDNGKGFPEEIDFKNTNSLGLQLVNTLVEQLNGKIELKRDKSKGTGFYINFPI